ncbi:MAG: malate synthase G, partial [Gammaproteobacteria bacterium]
MSANKQDYISAGYVAAGDLAIARPLHDLVRDGIIPGTGVSSEGFWNSLATILNDIGPKNDALVAHRDVLQKKIDSWHSERKNQPHDAAAYKTFLQEIGYLTDDIPDFRIATCNVDREIAEVAGPQLVVPLDNARYVLNAANARWGSLYDALYSSNAIPESDGCKKIKKYNPIRGEKVIEYARDFLDRNFPLEKDTHHH